MTEQPGTDCTQPSSNLDKNPQNPQTQTSSLNVPVGVPAAVKRLKKKPPKSGQAVRTQPRQLEMIVKQDECACFQLSNVGVLNRFCNGRGIIEHGWQLCLG